MSSCGAQSSGLRVEQRAADRQQKFFKKVEDPFDSAGAPLRTSSRTPTQVSNWEEVKRRIRRAAAGLIESKSILG